MEAETQEADWSAFWPPSPSMTRTAQPADALSFSRPHCVVCTPGYMCSVCHRINPPPQARSMQLTSEPGSNDPLWASIPDHLATTSSCGPVLNDDWSTRGRLADRCNDGSTPAQRRDNDQEQAARRERAYQERRMAERREAERAARSERDRARRAARTPEQREAELERLRLQRAAQTSEQLAAATAQQRVWRAAPTADQREAQLAAATAQQRVRRAAQTADQREAQLAAASAQQRVRRAAQTADQREAQLAAASAQQGVRRAAQTADQREAQLAAATAQQGVRRAAQTADQRGAQLAAATAQQGVRRAAQTADHRGAQLAAATAQQGVRRAAQTADRRGAQLAAATAHQRVGRAAQTPEQQQAQLAVRRERDRLRRAARTEEQREADLAVGRERARVRRAERSTALEQQHCDDPLASMFAKVKDLVKDPELDSAWRSPRSGVADDLADAVQFSQYMESNLPTQVCAVCGVYRGAADLSTVLVQNGRGEGVFDLSPLRRDGPKTSKLPRPGLTVCRIGGIDYCLERSGVQLGGGAFSLEPLSSDPARIPDSCVEVAVFPASAEVSLHVCADRCLPALRRKAVPRYSLVSFDAGRVPNLPDLVPLSPVEELIVAPLRANRLTIVARPPVPVMGRGRDTYQSYLQGHVVAVPNVPLDAWDRLVTPLHPDALADFVEVVILSHAATAEEAERMAKRVRCIKIRPRVVVAWIRWLRRVYSAGFADLGIVVDEHALRYYESAEAVSVPVSVQRNLHVMSTERDAERAVDLASGIRAGYANVRPDVADPVVGPGSSSSGPAMPRVDLDCEPDAPLVTTQLEIRVVDQILACFPCVVQLPARFDPQCEEVLLPPCSRVVSSWAVFLVQVQEAGLTDAPSLYRQIDLHVKAVVRQHQLGTGDDAQHMAGIEDVSVAVDLDGVVQAELPAAVQQIYDQHRQAQPADPDIAGEDEASQTVRIQQVFTGNDTQGMVGVVAGRGGVFPDMNKRWPAFTHPSMFPFGVGTPPVGMSYDAWLRIILQRAPSAQYAHQSMFVLDMFNVTQRHQVNKAAKHVLCTNEQSFRDFAAMSTDELVLATDLFAAKKRGRAQSEALSAAPVVVQKFLRALRQINVQVRATPAYFASRRSRAFAPWHAVGPYTVFPTNNPSELHSPSAMKLFGFDVEYGATGAPINMPPMVERWRAAAANPVACAQFFEVYRAAIWNVLYGWPRGKTGQQQSQPNCRFGRLRAIVDRAECSSRGGAHAHMLAAQSDMQPWHLRQLQRDAPEQLVQFARSIAGKELPAGWWAAGSGDWVDMSDPSKLAVDFRNVIESGQLGVCYKLPVARLQELLQQPEEARAAVAMVEEFQARLAGANQLHGHSHRCKKGNARGDDDDCVMYKPEETRSGAVTLEGGCMLLRCDHGLLVPHCPVLLLVDPCNQAIVLCWDASRWRTQQLRAERAGGDFDVAPPTLELHAAQAANYALKYITKRGKETDDLASVLVAACSSCKPTDVAGMSSEQTVDVGKRRAVQLVNKFNGKLVVPQTLAALYLCGFDDFCMTHKVVGYYPSSFAAALRERVAPHLAVHVRDDKETATAVNTGGGRLEFVNLVADYKHRNEALWPLPAYFYLMCADKVTARSAAEGVAGGDGQGGEEDPAASSDAEAAAGTSIGARSGRTPRPVFALAAEHPQSVSHTVVLRSELHLPQAISNYPAEPAEDAPQPDKDAYAVSILSMLMPDRVLERLCALGYSVWDVFLAWRAQAAGTPLHNFDLLMVEGYSVAAVDSAQLVLGFDWLQQQQPLPELPAAFDLLQQALSAGVVVPEWYSRWHMLGHYVLRNVQSLAAAQAEDRRRAALVGRAQLRQAMAVRGGGDSGGSDDGVDSESDGGVEWEEDAWAQFSANEPSRDPHELLHDLLTSVPANSRVSQYAEAALSRLPPVDFGTVDQQRPFSPPVATTGYLKPADVKGALTSGDMVQTAAAAAQLAAAQSSGSVRYDLQSVGVVVVQGMSLLQMGSPGVHARIQYIGGDNLPGVAELSPAQHGPPPDKKLAVPPSIVDTIRLFTLSTEQAFAFGVLADAWLLEKQGTKLAEPLRLVLTGEPGTGKSQVLKAFEWFALQYDASKLLLVASYTWRAALQVATAKHPALSTCRAFAIDPIKKRVGDSEHVAGVRFVFLDEYSFIDCQHLAHISESVRKALGCAPGDGSRAFGDMNVVLCGDLCQHKPVVGLPLFVDNNEREASNQRLRAEQATTGFLARVTFSATEWSGLTAYRGFDKVVFLRQQQRIRRAGDKLFLYSRLFIRETRPPRHEVEVFCDELNAKVVDAAMLREWAAAGHVPRVVCLRNDIRKTLNWVLGSLHAKHLAVRPIVWFCPDTLSTGRGQRLAADPSAGSELPQTLKDAVKCMKPEDTQGVPAMQLFFPGCKYTFNENVAPSLGYVNNSECEGVDLLVAPGEQDDLQQSCWILKRPPVALFVRAIGADMSHDAWVSLRQVFPSLPEGCIPLTPGWTPSFKVTAHMEQRATPGGPVTVKTHTANVRRFGINLSDAYAVTDYYCQGANFKRAKWMAHLSIPPDRAGLKRPAVFVVSTRWGDWEDVWLLAPLWPAGDAEARAAVIDAFHKLACLEPELAAELRRLSAAAEACKVSMTEEWQRAVDATA